jgi:NAD(P)-dependent dehydrogenase (short-subunit alcohol dehydrogenase family)
LVAAARAEGAQVLAIARTAADLAELAQDFSGVRTLGLDAAAEGAPEAVFASAVPEVLVMCGGARPTMSPLHEQSWEQFSKNWNVDVKASFAFCTAALRRPLAPGSTVVLISSGAGLAGSQLSGGYAGAKRTQMFIAEYAQAESDRLNLGIRFLAIVPRYIMSTTPMGRAAVAGYSGYRGITPEEFIARTPGTTTPAEVAKVFVELVCEPRSEEGDVFTVSSAGVEAVP